MEMETEVTQTELTQVESSNINRIGYTSSEKLILEYKSGARYMYENVPKNLYEELRLTESKGKFVNQHIKGQYEFKRLA